jgi:putative methyltransferase (TIGR04325 family)
VKALLKRLLPPILLDVARGAREPQYVWDGVYPHLKDVPTHRADYGGELTDEMVSTTTAALAEWRGGAKPYLWHEPFALVAGSLAAERGAIRVLDFGGGTGSGYVQLISSLPKSTRIDYLVVDSAEMGQAGRKIFGDDPQIRFAEALPAAGGVDLVYVNGVFPYIEDYRDMMGQLAGLGAAQIFLARLAAGANPTFASRQLNLPGRVFAYWFLNLNEVHQTLAQAGYKLACDSFVDRAYDQSNLPASHRAERFRNVLYTRAGTGR